MDYLDLLEARVDGLELKMKLLETRVESQRQVIIELGKLAEIQKKIYEAEIADSCDC